MYENYKKFLGTMKDLEPYLVEFNKDVSIRTKEYSANCLVGGDKSYPVIVFTYDEYIFSTKYEIYKACT